MHARRTTAPIIAVLVAAAFTISGCGSGSGSTSNASSPSAGGSSAPSQSVPPTVSGAVTQCLQQAKQIPQADARKTAEESCNAAKTGDTSKVKSAAKKQCLDAVAQVPDSAKAQKDAAKARCDAIK